MSPKVFLGLLLVTVVSVVAAVTAILQQPEVTPLEQVDAPAFPDLRANPDAVDQVIVTTADGGFRLVREVADRWIAPDRAGYPVNGRRVRDLIVALADMRLVEGKTTQPDQYHRLEVEDVDVADAKSRQVRLETVGGEILVDVLLGKTRNRRTGTEAAGIYVRRPGEAESWLASGNVAVATDVKDWLDQEVVDIDNRRIRQVEVQPTEGPPYAVLREDQGVPLQLADLGEGETVADDADPDGLGFALAGVRFDDVVPRVDVTWPSQPYMARITTFDGVQVTVELAEIDDQRWAVFRADAVEATPTAEDQPAVSDAAEPDVTGPEAPDPEMVDSEMAESGGAETAATDESDPDATDADGEGEPEAPAAPAFEDAATLGARIDNWAYRVSDTFFERLTKPRSVMVTRDDGTS